MGIVGFMGCDATKISAKEIAEIEKKEEERLQAAVQVAERAHVWNLSIKDGSSSGVLKFAEDDFWVAVKRYERLR
jgi:hypothetical protein